MVDKQIIYTIYDNLSNNKILLKIITEGFPIKESIYYSIDYIGIIVLMN